MAEEEKEVEVVAMGKALRHRWQKEAAKVAEEETRNRGSHSDDLEMGEVFIP